jgi:GxxExxY protein
VNHQDTKARSRDSLAPIASEFERIAAQVVDAAFAVHSELGPGLLESIYERCLVRELHFRGVDAQCQLAVPIRYRGLWIDPGLRLDILAGGCVVVEVKAVDVVVPVHLAQLLTYLKLTGHRLGLLVNFNVPLIKQGIRRIAL